MRSLLIAAATIVGLGLAACDDKQAKHDAPPPKEVSDASVGHYCGMALNEHAGPKGQIFVAGRPEPVWFSSVRDTFAFTMLPEEPKDIAAIYVSDMGRAKNWDQPEPGTWIDGRKAWYVIGSGRKGGMGSDEAVPFGEEDAAKDFVARHGGRVVRFAEMPKGYIFPEGGDGPSAQPQTSEAPAAEADHGGHGASGHSIGGRSAADPSAAHDRHK